MKPRSLLVLLLVVLGLLAFIWFVERDLPSSEERAERAKRVLGELEEDQITVVTVRRGEEQVRLESDEAREDDAGARRWRLVEPMRTAADGEAANTLVDRLVELQHQRVLEEFEPADVGLDEPRATVTVTAGERELALDLGAAVPASSNMIVRRADRAQAYVVADDLWEAIDRPAGEWRSRDLFDVTRAEIEGLTLTGPAGSVTLARRDGAFWLQQPIDDRADPERTEDLLGDLVALEVEQFVDQPERTPAEMGLDPAAFELQLRLTGDRQAKLEIGAQAEEGQRFARSGEQVVLVDSTLEEALERPAGEWQSREWSSLDTWQVDRIELRDAQGELTLSREGSDWLRGQDRIDYDLVSDLLYAVDGVRAEALLAPAAADAEAPAALEMRWIAEDATDELRLLGNPEDGWVGITEGRAYRLALPVAEVEDLLLKVAEVRSAERLPDPSQESAEVEPES